MEPLSYRIRPKDFSEFVGQEHIVNAKWFKSAIDKKNPPSMILFGPPGIGKTTLALLIAEKTGITYKTFSAVTSTIKEVREFIESVYESYKNTGKKTIVFIDEIHRFNKAQQDAFLPWIEKGVIILIGTTTENPSFYINPPLLSRVKVINLNPLSNMDIEKILLQAIKKDRLLQNLGVEIRKDIIEMIIDYAKGDARVALNVLELIAENFYNEISLDEIEKIITDYHQPYDKKGDFHYNLISAFIKSMRGSDPDAAIYYLARMLESGEDPYFILRRMVIFASEDIGNADPHALMVATSAHYAFTIMGMPEGFIPISQAVTYLSLAPKSNASYKAYLEAKEDVKKYGALMPPLSILNPATKIMKDLGFGKGYKYPHDYINGLVKGFQYLPDAIKEKRYYKPKQIGYEKTLLERLQKIKGER
ncbi:MAG: replication-associated recombination protein A [Proteobacteria bacterium]|nr:replication-associated recombination protein A [Pseudomonadota bacterium]